MVYFYASSGNIAAIECQSKENRLATLVYWKEEPSSADNKEVAIELRTFFPEAICISSTEGSASGMTGEDMDDFINTGKLPKAVLN